MSTTPPAPGHPVDASAGGMIDFGCGSCGRLLKVPAQAAGKQARCPQCGAVQQVPAGRTAPGGPVPARGSTAARPLLSAAPRGISADHCSAARADSGGLLRAAGPHRDRCGFPLVVAPTACGAPAAPRRTRDTHEAVVRPHHSGSGEDLRGQEELVLGTLVALFSSGHVLIESVPGSGKDACSCGRWAACWAAASAAFSSPPT